MPSSVLTSRTIALFKDISASYANPINAYRVAATRVLNRMGQEATTYSIIELANTAQQSNWN